MNPSNSEVFVSYARKDEEIVRQIVMRLEAVGVSVWRDGDRIRGGDTWTEEIVVALRGCKLVLLIASPHSLSSVNVAQEILWTWESSHKTYLVLWISSPSAFPDRYSYCLAGSHYLLLGGRVVEDWLPDVCAALTKRGIAHRGPAHAPSPVDDGRIFTVPAVQPRLVHLPVQFPVPENFKGRNADLARLDTAWADPGVNVLTIHAMGGVGKSSLVGFWLGQLGKEGYRGARIVYGYSFEGTSGDRFIESALGDFGDPDPTQGDPEAKGRRLAERISRQRTLLVLDGFQSVQESEGEVGKIRSLALQALVCALAMSNPGLCIICTRLPVPNLYEATAPQYELENLSPPDGAELLKDLGVHGPQAELEQTSVDVEGHALTLNLLGSFLCARWYGDVSKRGEVLLLEQDKKEGGRARQVMASYEAFLAPKYLAALRLVSLFIRPARPDAVRALLARPPIPGLTDDLVDPDEGDWNELVSYLRNHKLLKEASIDVGASAPAPAILDMHPLVREYFAAGVPRHPSKTFQLAQQRLFQHFRRTRPDRPETTEEMGPLYLAVQHGCQAERFDEVLQTVYWPRIKREKSAFNTKKLGAFLADLTVLHRFFQHAWDRLYTGIDAKWHARLFYEVAFDLRALGRLGEAVKPTQAALALCLWQRDFPEAAEKAGDLSLLYVTLGLLSRARQQARHAVRYADRSGCLFEAVRQRANLAHACLQLGELEQAWSVFGEAHAIVRVDEARPANGRRRPSLQSYWFYEVLLARGEHEQSEELVRRPMADRTPTGIAHLDAALAETAVARSRMKRAESLAAADALASMHESAVSLEHARQRVEKAGTKHHQPRILLAQAALHRLRGVRHAAAGDVASAANDLRKARQHLDDILELVRPRGMKVYEADALLEYARLSLAQNDEASARVYFREARTLVAEMEYHRRKHEVEELSVVLGDAE